MRIDTDNLLTIEQAAAEIGAPNKRPVYRAIQRARAAGKETAVVLYGKTLVPRDKIVVLKDFYYPYYSEAHQKMVKQWGASGGTQKKKNAEARAAKPKS
ncbi:MAG: hypothetical protein EBR82_53875 [Caulobacteraceae bacterium]|nr:hypothetical protein [Caulobacteraceae bacterium]NDC26046.1 hypothetical protein [Pseudomonadota bacterium]NDD04552.1 hypothetical protein [Pseudomonadota bacterium]